jgi:hypothetical protein
MQSRLTGLRRGESRAVRITAARIRHNPAHRNRALNAAVVTVR